MDSSGAKDAVRATVHARDLEAAGMFLEGLRHHTPDCAVYLGDGVVELTVRPEPFDVWVSALVPARTTLAGAGRRRTDAVTSVLSFAAQSLSKGGELELHVDEDGRLRFEYEQVDRASRAVRPPPRPVTPSRQTASIPLSGSTGWHLHVEGGTQTLVPEQTATWFRELGVPVRTLFSFGSRWYVSGLVAGIAPDGVTVPAVAVTGAASVY